MAVAHDFEPELSQPVPRPVRWRGGRGIGCGIWFVRLFLLPHTLAGLFILGLAVAGSLSWLGVHWFGTETDARIVRKEEYKPRKGKTVYRLHYAYAVEGREYHDQAAVTAKEYAARQEGQALALRVLPWMPTAHWVRLPGADPAGTVGGYWVGALLWNGLMAVFLWAVWLRPWMQRRLVRWGVAAPGIVRDVQAVRTKRGYSYTVTYEYASTGGEGQPEQLFTRSASANGDEAASLRKGDVLTVLYDPQRPKRSIPYQLALYEAYVPAAEGSQPHDGPA